MQYRMEDCGKFKMIRISGNIDTAESTKELDDEIGRLRKQGSHHFVFNLRETSYLDSAGISIFIHALCDVQEHSGSVYIIAEDNQVYEVLKMVGINRLIKTYTDEDLFMSEHVTVDA